jgi:hypothetical protein
MFVQTPASTLSVRLRVAPNSRTVLLDAEIAGQRETATTFLRLDPSEVTHLTAAISRMSLGYVAVRAGDSLDPVEDLGAQLFDLVFDGPLSQLWYLNVASAEVEGRMTRIVIQPDDDVLSALPWELMFDRRRGSFVALSPRTPLVRRSLPNDIAPMPPRPPVPMLRILPVGADVDGFGVFKADDVLFSNLQKAAEGASSRVEILPRVNGMNGTALAELASAPTVDVLHFSGTGNFAGDEHTSRRDSINFGNGQRVSTHEVMAAVRRMAPRLVFLSSDNSAWFAKELAQHVPVAIGLQGLVAEESTIAFEHAFYHTIVAGRSVETAVTRARQALHDRKPAVRDWALITAYSQSLEDRFVSAPARVVYARESWARPSDAAPSNQTLEPDAQRQFTRLQRRLELLTTNLAALKTRQYISAEAEEQIRTTERQIEELTTEIRSLRSGV